MTFFKCLLPAALLLSASAYAQTSQTFHFGEGQSSLGSAHSTHAQPKPKSSHKPQHRRAATHHSSLDNPYSHP